MPTKARREKEAVRKAAREASAKESEWMNNRPATLDELGCNLADQQPPEPHWRLRGGLLEADELGNLVCSSTIGGGSAKTTARNKRIEELKTLYPDLWGIKGKASWIAALEARAGRLITARTIQKYFKAK